MLEEAGEFMSNHAHHVVYGIGAVCSGLMIYAVARVFQHLKKEVNEALLIYNSVNLEQTNPETLVELYNNLQRVKDWTSKRTLPLVKDALGDLETTLQPIISNEITSSLQKSGVTPTTALSNLSSTYKNCQPKN